MKRSTKLGPSQTQAVQKREQIASGPSTPTFFETASNGMLYLEGWCWMVSIKAVSSGVLAFRLQAFLLRPVLLEPRLICPPYSQASLKLMFISTVSSNCSFSSNFCNQIFSKLLMLTLMLLPGWKYKCPRSKHSEDVWSSLTAQRHKLFIPAARRIRVRRKCEGKQLMIFLIHSSFAWRNLFHTLQCI